jgi:hypothetical protein
MSPTERICVIARILARLKKAYMQLTPIPGQGRPLVWAEYVSLMGHVLAEYREE